MRKLTFVLFNGNESNNEIFVAEALKCPVIDTACKKTVAGQDRYNGCINNLKKKTKKNYKYQNEAHHLNLVMVIKFDHLKRLRFQQTLQA